MKNKKVKVGYIQFQFVSLQNVSKSHLNIKLPKYR